MKYDVVIIGGGIAGLQAAIQMGRYNRPTLLIDAGGGRSSLCRCYHNILGWPDGVSGQQLRALGRRQAESLGVTFLKGTVVEVAKENGDYLAKLLDGQQRQAKTVLFSTGVVDHIPKIPNLQECLGLSIFVCPDCDGYETIGRKTVVFGAGATGAGMAITLKFWTEQITYVDHSSEPLAKELLDRLRQEQLEVIIGQVVDIQLTADGNLGGYRLQDGRQYQAERAFLAFSKAAANSDLASKLGCERLENGHVLADPRTRMTSVRNVWVAGDVSVHSEQTVIAMGDGCQAAIWIHKTLLKEERKEKLEAHSGILK